MVDFVRNLFKPRRELLGFTFSRPLVVLQSDDWGRVGVRDREGCDEIRSAGIRLGAHPYDLYTLETAADVNAVAALLLRHRDSTGRTPCLVMNVCTANLDFNTMRADGYKAARFMPLSKGLPGKWSRPGLFDAYRAGLRDGAFYPSLHGMSHSCSVAMENALAQNNERARLLRLFWRAETPYIYWRMPWVGYEYWNPEKPRAGFLAAVDQQRLIAQAVENFSDLFGMRPVSACAPGCRANHDTHKAWSEAGIHVAESGTGSGLRAPHMDDFGILHLYRTIDFEPSQRELEVDKYLEVARTCFARGLPLIVSVHSINFHSTLKDFCTPTLASLDKLLNALESQYPELLYVHDEDLYQIVSVGAFQGRSSRIPVTVRREPSNSRLLPEAAL
ncbi:MAG TPA: hypothetical protein VGU90_01940 [Terriglobales bacterium]|nr:hypothetical protein [Terriglobales bacterium]